jgi:Flp pilus assembly protein TadG
MKAPPTMPAAIRRRALGVAHIELAFILLTMAVLLPLVFSFGQIFYVYSVVKQANSDAAAALAAVPMSEWVVSLPADSPMKLRAAQIARQALASASISPAIALEETTITCKVGLMSGAACGGANRASAIKVNLRVSIPVVGVMNMFDIGDSITIMTTVTVPYTN